MADDLDDAIQIIDARQGTIRKWVHSPAFLIVHDRPINRVAVGESLAHINDATGLGIGEPTFLDVSAATFGDRFYRESSYRPKRQEDGTVQVDVTIAAEVDYTAKGNIVVFMLQPQLASHMIVASGFGRGSNSLERGYLRSPQHCFFDIRSDDKSIRFGRVFISSELELEKQAGCIYEEFTQTMGLVADATGSVFFTYDDRATDKPRNHDKRLLSALYDPSVAYGDPVSKVVVLYALSAPR